MNAHAARAGLQLCAIAGLLGAAACTGDHDVPDTIFLPGHGVFTAAPTTTEDSVCSGYGCPATGGIEYTCFEYEPDTGTEYVVTPDTACRKPAPKPTTPTSPR